MNSRRTPPGQRRRAAFTLVELLAATTVLTLLLVVVVQMINSATTVTSGTARHLDADSQARLVFDRMAVDFAQIVKRTDVDYFFVKMPNAANSTHNDQMAFYSETSGYYPSWANGPVPRSNVALVGYCINNCQLQRLSKALIWNGVSTGGDASVRPMTFLPQTLPSVWPLAFSNSNAAPTSPDMSAGTDKDYQVIGESVFRMEICYFMPKTATGDTTPLVSGVPYLQPGATPTPSPLPSSTPYNGMRDVSSVVVTIAVLDDTSRLTIPSNNLNAVLTAAGAVLEDGPVGTSSPGVKWQSHVDDRTLVTQGNLPPRAASQVRIYERYFPLGNAR